jgi:hypothetical protein
LYAAIFPLISLSTNFLRNYLADFLSADRRCGDGFATATKKAARGPPFLGAGSEAENLPAEQRTHHAAEQTAGAAND